MYILNTHLADCTENNYTQIKRNFSMYVLLWTTTTQPVLPLNNLSRHPAWLTPELHYPTHKAEHPELKAQVCGKLEVQDSIAMYSMCLHRGIKRVRSPRVPPQELPGSWVCACSGKTVHSPFSHHLRLAWRDGVKNGALVPP